MSLGNTPSERIMSSSFEMDALPMPRRRVDPVAPFLRFVVDVRPVFRGEISGLNPTVASCVGVKVAVVAVFFFVLAGIVMPPHRLEVARKLTVGGRRAAAGPSDTPKASA